MEDSFDIDFSNSVGPLRMQEREGCRGPRSDGCRPAKPAIVDRRLEEVCVERISEPGRLRPNWSSVRVVSALRYNYSSCILKWPFGNSPVVGSGNGPEPRRDEGAPLDLREWAPAEPSRIVWWSPGVVSTQTYMQNLFLLASKSGSLRTKHIHSTCQQGPSGRRRFVGPWGACCRRMM